MLDPKTSGDVGREVAYAEGVGDTASHLFVDTAEGLPRHEVGHVSSWNDSYVFVKFPEGVKACHRRDLAWVVRGK